MLVSCLDWSSLGYFANRSSFCSSVLSLLAIQNKKKIADRFLPTAVFVHNAGGSNPAPPPRAVPLSLPADDAAAWGAATVATARAAADSRRASSRSVRANQEVTNTKKNRSKSRCHRRRTGRCRFPSHFVSVRASKPGSHKYKKQQIGQSPSSPGLKLPPLAFSCRALLGPPAAAAACASCATFGPQPTAPPRPGRLPTPKPRPGSLADAAAREPSAPPQAPLVPPPPHAPPPQLQPPLGQSPSRRCYLAPQDASLCRTRRRRCSPSQPEPVSPQVHSAPHASRPPPPPPCAAAWAHAAAAAAETPLAAAAEPPLAAVATRAN